jgi:hypothetical protein
MKLLKENYPAMAKKVMEGNPLVVAMAQYNLCTMDILKYPICNHCETLALWTRFKMLDDGRRVGVCVCPKCNTESVDPLKVDEWIMMELKKKAPDVTIDDLVFATDETAKKIVDRANRTLRKAVKENRYE